MSLARIIPLRPLQMPVLGSCASCGQRIKLVGGATQGQTCSAWRRWYIAHRIASRHLLRR